MCFYNMSFSYPKSTVVIKQQQTQPHEKWFKIKWKKSYAVGFLQLKYLYENGYIKLNIQEERQVSNFTFNGSKILVLPEVEASAVNVQPY